MTNRYYHCSQDEEALLCRVATGHDLADAFQLKSTTGWQTLLAILQSTGERTPLKRRRDESDPGSSNSSPFRSHTDDPEAEHVAKRLAAVRLNRTTGTSDSEVIDLT